MKSILAAVALLAATAVPANADSGRLLEHLMYVSMGDQFCGYPVPRSAQIDVKIVAAQEGITELEVATYVYIAANERFNSLTADEQRKTCSYIADYYARNRG